MKILSLILDNFKGIKHFELIPNGESINVDGDNGSGKTTLFDAFCWLLYGKPSTGEKNFSPQTIGTHHLDHSVEMLIDTGDGKRTYKKTFHEVYKTQRGASEKVFSGYTTDHFVDGVPVAEKEYAKAMETLFQSEEVAKLLTRYNYFLEDMKVKDRRNLLLQMCVDISPDELRQRVIQSTDELKDLPDVLNGREIEDYIKIASAQKKKIDAELKQIPARIDEAEKSKPEALTTAVDRDAIEKQITELKARKKDLEGQAAAVDVTAENDIRKKIAETEAQRALAQSNYQTDVASTREKQRAQIENVEIEKRQLETAVKLMTDSLADREAAVQRHGEAREKLLTEWTELKAREWDGDTVCPVCGQTLPAEQIEAAKRNFNYKKAEELEIIKAEGKKVSADVIEAERNEIETMRAQVNEKQGAIAELESKILEIKASQNDPDPFDSQEFDLKLAELQEQLKDITKASGGKKEELRCLIDFAEKQIAEKQELLSMFSVADQQDKRIAELAAQEKKLAAEYEKIDRGIYLCELYNRCKAEMLTDNINSKFKTLKFRLFIEQINGGIADDCEALLSCESGYVPFKSANMAAKINAGLEIIDTLAEHYGFTLPLFIDGCESVNDLRTTKAQQIRLYVSNDKALTVRRVE